MSEERTVLRNLVYVTAGMAAIGLIILTIDTLGAKVFARRLLAAWRAPAPEGGSAADVYARLAETGGYPDA